MKNIIIELHNVLNMIKGITAGYGSRTLKEDFMLIEREGDGVYQVQITKIGDKDKTIDDFQYML